MKPIIDIPTEPVEMVCGQCGRVGKLYNMGMQSVFWCPACSPAGLQDFCERFMREKIHKIVEAHPQER